MNNCAVCKGLVDVANKMEDPRQRDCPSLRVVLVLYRAFIHAASHDAAL